MLAATTVKQEPVAEVQVKQEVQVKTEEEESMQLYTASIGLALAQSTRSRKFFSMAKECVIPPRHYKAVRCLELARPQLFSEYPFARPTVASHKIWFQMDRLFLGAIQAKQRNLDAAGLTGRRVG